MNADTASLQAQITIQLAELAEARTRNAGQVQDESLWRPVAIVAGLFGIGAGAALGAAWVAVLLLLVR
ncbi:hypothetical protein XacyCFBP2565_21920 [Xanthomonas arboricola pv. corylina]|uniref:hypothetical protein n=1 Tax=Xanthomonas arboricola TaxID=56448 RepID=UPI000CEEFC1D|nr:hypothetical protein [Xanthomonas arboricola]PPU05222.1 hypothetical protein XacyCFBP2565_21920 [Xanthomonas arboricola pv. corylina]